MTSPGFLIPAATGEAELKEKGSRFLAVVVPVVDEGAARDLLAALQGRHPDATHHCWAWRLGWPPSERAADAGEPRGTAGQPILRVLQGADISDVMAVVVRWFGGTKLGKGGLARAYAAATRLALDGLPTERKLARQRLAVTLPYHHLGALQRFVHPPEVEIVAEAYRELVRLELAVAPSQLLALEELLASLGAEVEERLEG